MSGLQGLRVFVSRRLHAAVDEIFAHFERTILEYEQEMERRHRKPPEAEPRHADGQQLLREEEEEEEVPPERQGRISSLDQEIPHIKEEQLWSGQEEVPPAPDPVKSEDEEEKPQPSEKVEADPPSGVKTEADGGAEPARSSETDRRTSWAPEPEESFVPDRIGPGASGSAAARHGDGRYGADKPISCSECGKTVSSKSGLHYHKKIHTGEKLFGCSFCSKSFRKRSHLVEHMRIHTGERPFACPVCGKRFAQQGHIKSHMMTHTRDKPFSCRLCQRSFTWKYQLKTHECRGEKQGHG